MESIDELTHHCDMAVTVLGDLAERHLRDLLGDGWYFLRHYLFNLTERIDSGNSVIETISSEWRAEFRRFPSAFSEDFRYFLRDVA